MIQQYGNTSEFAPAHPGLEALEDGFCMLDARWRVTYWNAAAERLLRLARADILGRVLWDVLPFLRSTSTWSNLNAVRLERAPRRFLDSHPPFGTYGFASIYAAPLEDGGLAVHFRDATAEVMQGEQHAALLESIRDGFIAVDAHWNIVFLNGVAESLLRFSREQAQGVSLWSLLPRGPAEIRDCLWATKRDGIQRHLRSVRPEGRVFRGRVFDLWTYPLIGGGISILFEDVSERAQREGELARLADEAREANQAKSRFFAAISHELRTPLNAIVGYTHLLGTGTYGEMPAGARRAAERASVCAEHLSRLVDDVLLLTTAEIGRLPVIPAPVELREYLPSIIETHRHQAEAKGLAFSVEVEASVPQVETDPQRLRQLLLALLSNAVKYTNRGEVRIEVRMCEVGPGMEREEDGYSLFPEPRVEIGVVDTGPGIAPEDRERIFGPFEQIGDPARSNSMTRGTGLGLTIARQLSNLLHGTLYLAETSASGSRFCLHLPLSFPTQPS